MGNFWNDIIYIQEQLAMATSIPKSYLNYSNYSDTIESEEDFENKTYRILWSIIMSQPFNIVMATAEIMRNSYHAGYRATGHFPRKYDDRYIEFFGMNENGESTGVEYDKEDSMDKRSIDYLMGVLQEILDKNSKLDEYWGC